MQLLCADITAGVTHKSVSGRRSRLAADSWRLGGRKRTRLQRSHSLTSRPSCFQLLVDGAVTSVVLDGLTPLTQYLVHVYAVVGEISSEPLTGTETTRKCSSSSLT